MKPHVFIGPVLVAVVVLLTGVAMAGAPPTPNLLDRLIALEARVTALETELAAIKSSPVMALNNYLTVTTGDKPRARFSGLNLQVVNGTGYTGFVNGLGNVIIGYDEQRPWSPTQEYCSSGEFGDQGSCENAGHTWASNHKSGSHYLVVGEYNNYSQYAGVVAGLANTSNAPYAIAIGGYGNVASRVYATVLGGSSNTASGQNATVTAGQNNVASAYATSVTGGWFNRASGLGSSVSGGNLNTASGEASHVSGGS